MAGSFFWRQLRLLLWKNFLIKRRQKLWLAVELLAPILLFLVLVIIRTQNFAQLKDTCHYDSKALPSAGVLPFLSDFFCRLANKCHSIPTTGDDRGVIGRDYNGKEFVKQIHATIKLLAAVGHDSGPMTELAEHFVQGVRVLAELSNDIQLVAGSSHNVPLTAVFEPGLNVTEALIHAGMNSSDAVAASHAFLTPFFFKLALQTAIEEDKLSLVCENPWILAEKIVSKAFCGDNLRESVVIGDGGNPPTALCNFAWFKSDNLEHFVKSPAVIMDAAAAVLSELSERMITGAQLGRLTKSFCFLMSSTNVSEVMPLIQYGLDFLENITIDEELKQDTLIDILMCNTTQEIIAKMSNPDGSMVSQGNLLRNFVSSVVNVITNGPRDFNDTAVQFQDENCLDAPATNSYPPHCAQIMFDPRMRAAFGGYILVTPDAPVVRALVAKLEIVMRDVNIMRSTLLDLHSNADTYQSALHDSDLHGATVALEDWARQLNESNQIKLSQESAKRLELLLQLVGPANDSRSLFLLLKNVTAAVANYSDCFLADRFRFYDNEAKMERIGKCLGMKNYYFSGLTFVNLSSTATYFPPFVTYKIRPAPLLTPGTDNASQHRDAPWDKGPVDNPFHEMDYLTFGFTYFQDAVERAVIEMKSNRSFATGLHVQQMPYPCSSLDKFNQLIPQFVPLFFVLSWVIPSSLTVKNIVQEKEMRLKEVMKVMGLGDAVHWIAWGLFSFAMSIIPTLLIVIMLSFGRIFSLSDPTVLLVFFVLYTWANISKTLLLATFFDRANVASAATALIYWVDFFAYGFGREILRGGLKKISCIFTQTAVGWGIEELYQRERRGGIFWSQVVGDSDDIPLIFIMGMFVIQTVVQLTLAWYISNVFPGQYGIAQPWYFFVTRSYWCGLGRTITDGDDGILAERSERPEDGFEPEPENVTLGVRVRNLRKEFSNGTVAVDGLNLKFYESQITSFLGHNGAGKTTTMSILTGLYRPTAGTAYIYDMDIRTHFAEIRQSLGMCPQHNILFDQLTVEEQLRFYADLKGLSRKAADIEIDQMLVDVNLEEKRDEFAINLSGGMKRRLSIAVAFIGGSRTVILDEPTAGVDPHSRRGIWDLLLKFKQGRTIILSTHHMDEADVLGDRIAIIAHGRLRACGSSLFLKTKFGSGCNLAVLQRPRRAQPDNRTAEDIERRLIEFVLSNVPGSNLTETIRSELFFTLPVTLDPINMATFFDLFDRNRRKLGVVSYGINATSLEEIFLKVAPCDQAALKKVNTGFNCCGLIDFLRRKFSKRSTLYENVSMSVSVITSSESGIDLSISKEQRRPGRFAKHPVVELLEGGCQLVTQRLVALFIKRWHHYRRSLKSVFFQIIVPVILISLAYLATSLIEEYQELEDKPAMLISTWMYSDSYPSLSKISKEDSSTLRVFSSIGADTSWKSASRGLGQLLTTAPGFGFCCVRMQPFSNEMNKCNANGATEWTQSYLSNYTVRNDTCSCQMGKRHMQFWQCAAKYQPEPRERRLPTNELLVDMTNRNISQWVLDTHNELSWIRYGGFSFGDRNDQAMNESEKSFAVSGLLHVGSLLEQMAANLSIRVSSTPATPSANQFNSGQTLADVLGRVVRNLDFEDNLKVWFNSKGWASVSLYLNAINNLILRSLLSDQDHPENHGIAVMNHPMNYSGSHATGTIQSFANLGRTQMIQVVLMILAFSIVSASFIIFLVEERVTQAKHLQFVSGVPPWLYWVSNYLWDMVSFLLSVLMVLVVLLIADADAFMRTGAEATALFLLLMFYGLAICPLVFLCSFVFEVPPVAFVLFSGCSFFLAVITSLSVTFLQYIVYNEMVPLDSSLYTAYHVCSIVFMVFPQYSLGQGLTEMSMSYSMYKVALGMVNSNQDALLLKELPIPSLFSWEKLGSCYCVLFIEAMLGFALLLLVEYHRSIFRWQRNLSNALAENRALNAAVADDRDVVDERERVQSTPAEAFGLVIKDLTKIFNRKLVAVDRLTVGVARGECFGLLGVNGAGKTTTFSMLTSMLQPTEGDALFQGNSILRDMHQIHQMLGYCPQFDALNGRLTAKEQLTFYAGIRGIQRKDIKEVVEWAIENMHLTMYANEPSDSYSGGNKRKLSTALALIGNPAVVLLDEPSAGMDPNTRRFMWNLIIQLRKENRTVVLTSHSMEECEKLCTSIGIMVSGRLQCIGTVQHLKYTFGEGYTLQFKLRSATDADFTRVNQIVESELKGARLTDRHCSTLQYRLTRGLQLGKTFHVIQKIRQTVELEDFALSQTTLDDVFINFASKHCAGDERPARQKSMYGSLSIDGGPFVPAVEKPQSEADCTRAETDQTQTDADLTQSDGDDSQMRTADSPTGEASATEVQMKKKRPNMLARQDPVADLIDLLDDASQLSESTL